MERQPTPPPLALFSCSLDYDSSAQWWGLIKWFFRDGFTDPEEEKERKEKVSHTLPGLGFAHVDARGDSPLRAGSTFIVLVALVPPRRAWETRCRNGPGWCQSFG